MNCRHVWSSDFLDEQLSRHWRNTVLRAHQEQLLWERERSLLPATQPAVMRVVERRKREREIQELRQQQYKIQRQLRRLRYLQDGGGDQNAEQDQSAATSVLCACSKPACKGFVIRQRGASLAKCGVCNSSVCGKCLEEVPALSSSGAGAMGPAEEAHVCKPENIESARLVLAESKPCPGCAARIFRVSGCDQMWCTQCHVAFNWRTGEKVVNGRIHNPHYYEWLVTNPSAAPRPRELGDVPCGGLPDVHLASRHLRNLGADKTLITNIMDSLRHLNHTHAIDMPSYHVNRMPQDNEALRVSFMLNEVPEQEFRKRVIKQQRLKEKRYAVYQVLEMYTHVGVDLFGRIMAATDVASLRELLKELQGLQRYVGSCFDRLKERFGTVRLPVHYGWTWGGVGSN